MTIKEWVQLFFALSNGASFLLTFLHGWRPKLAGSLVLVVAHPTVAAYFLSTGQPIFVLGNAIMTAGGLYGIWRALRARRRAQHEEAMAAVVREGWATGLARSEGPLRRALQQVAKDLDRRG